MLAIRLTKNGFFFIDSISDISDDLHAAATSTCQRLGRNTDGADVETFGLCDMAVLRCRSRSSVCLEYGG